MTNEQKNVNATKNPSLTVKSARNLFLLTIGLVIIIGGIAQYYNKWLGLTLTEILLILTPVLLFIYKRKLSLKYTLRLNHKGMTGPVIVAIILGILVWPIGIWGQLNLMELFYGKDADLIPSLNKLGEANMLYRFLVMGVLAAICEEFLFRGYMQSAFEQNIGVRKSIIWTAILFSIYHLDPATIISLFPLSVLLTWVCWKFNSILPSVALHFSNNFLSVFIFSKITYTNLAFFYLLMAVSTLLLLVIVFVIHKKYKISNI
jgi:membrane protease YdiL (CAAX protease family)